MKRPTIGQMWASEALVMEELIQNEMAKRGELRMRIMASLRIEDAYRKKLNICLQEAAWDTYKENIR